MQCRISYEQSLPFRIFAIIRSPCSRSRTPREADANRIRLQGFCRTLGQHRNNHPESAREQPWKELIGLDHLPPHFFTTPSVERTWQLHVTSISCMAYRMIAARNTSHPPPFGEWWNPPS